MPDTMKPARHWLRRRRDALMNASPRALIVIVLAVAELIVIIVVASSPDSTSRRSASGPVSIPFATTEAAVPTNRVEGSGSAVVRLSGDTATVTVTTQGLLNGSPHLMHIHGLGLGGCPTAADARRHQGHLAISTGNGIRYYGPALTSLTEYGSTSGSVPTNIDMNLYSAAGTIHYTRTIVLAPRVAATVRSGNAVIVIHGIDYNGNHVYDFGALGVSDLDRSLPAEATAPALCGALRASPSAAASAGNPARPQATTYVATFHRTRVPSGSLPVAQQSLPGDRLSLFCHLGSAVL